MRRIPPRKQFLQLGVGSIIFAAGFLTLGAVMVIFYFLVEGSSGSLSDDEVARFTVLFAMLFITLGLFFIWVASLSLRNRKYLPDGTQNTATGDQAVCAECQGTFKVQDMIAHNGLHVCARCKPIFLQKLAEGAKIGSVQGREKS